MNLKSLLARPFANYIYNKTRKSIQTAREDQEAILKMLLKTGKNTVFGKEHKVRGGFRPCFICPGGAYTRL
jgi:hypothetical protein